MKTKITTLTLALFLSLGIFAQAPDGVNYQAVVRNPLGLALNTQNVDVRFTIHQGSPTGPSVFQEVHNTNTNQFGLINLVLGSVNNATFTAINWGVGGAYYLQIEVDAGNGFDDLGASQLLSVPYALFARSAATGAQGFNSLIDTISATAANCPTGGYEVLTGLDANANTVLDAAEITSSFFVCNGGTGSGDNWGTDVVNTSGTNITGDGTIGNPLIVTEVDGSITNEIQTISINVAQDTIFLSNGGFIEVPTVSGDNWGTDVVNTSGANITGDGTVGNPLVVIDAVNDADFDPTNELELPLVGNTTGDIMAWNGASWVSQPPAASGDNWGTDVVNTSGANITGDGTVGNPLVVIDAVNDADFDPTNEIQDLTISGNYISVTGGLGDSLSPNAPLFNQVLTWNGSAWVAQNPGSGADNWGSQVVITDATLSGNGTSGNPLSGFDGDYNSLTNQPTNVSQFTNDASYITSPNDADFDPNNEIQTLSFANPNLSLTNGGGTVNLSTLAGTDNQDLTFAGNTLSLTNDATPVNLSLYLDNTDGQTLSYTSATQNLSISGGNAVTLFVDDADNNPANEYNTNFAVNGANLELTDGGATRTVSLSSLAPNDGDWTISGNDMFSANSGNVGVGITPLHKLDVSGDINLNGVYRIDGVTFLDNKSTSTLVGATGNTGLTGLYNTIIGNIAGNQLTTGVRNTLIGRGAGNLLTTESDNILIGTVAGQGLTVGASNVMIGNYAGWAATNTGADNTFVGHRSGMANTLGSSNTFIGRYAGFANTTGANNTTLGYNSGDQITAGSNNTYIGYNADGSLGTLTNATAIGANANVTQSNSLILGNGADVGIRTSAPASALDVNGQISMQLGATAGYIPVSDPSGLMTWTDPSTIIPAAIWAKSGTFIYPSTLTDFIGIGTVTPLNPLDVIHTATAPNNSAAHIDYVFNGTGLGINAGLHIEANNANGSNDTWGVYSSTSGVSNNGASDIGVGAYANATGGGDHKGIDAGAISTAGNNFGGIFAASGATTGNNYGVYGTASGSSTNNWAGYFELGDVYIQNNLGINSLAPIAPLHVEGNTYINGTTALGGSLFGLAARLKVYAGSGAGTAYFYETAGTVGVSILASGQMVIGGSSGVGSLLIQETDANTTGASGSHVNIQNLANATNTTAGLRFRTGGSTAVNGDSHYKGAIFFEDGTGTNGEGDMIFAVNDVASSANVTTANAAMTISSLRNVGIGSTAPNARLHVNETTTNPALRVQINGTTQFIVANNGNVALNNNAAPAFKLHLNTNSAAKPTSSAWTVSSDARLKKDIKPYKGGLQDILKINPVWFTYNGKAGMPNETGVGVIAQDLQKVAPYMVNTWTYVEGSMDEMNPRTDGPKTDYLGVDNGAMTYMLINAVKEQQKQIEELRKEIEDLKNK